jgi:hypothetical protein
MTKSRKSTDLNRKSIALRRAAPLEAVPVSAIQAPEAFEPVDLEGLDTETRAVAEALGGHFARQLLDLGREIGPQVECFVECITPSGLTLTERAKRLGITRQALSKRQKAVKQRLEVAVEQRLKAAVNDTLTRSTVSNGEAKIEKHAEQS